MWLKECPSYQGCSNMTVSSRHICFVLTGCRWNSWYDCLSFTRSDHGAVWMLSRNSLSVNRPPYEPFSDRPDQGQCSRIELSQVVRQRDGLLGSVGATCSPQSNSVRCITLGHSLSISSASCLSMLDHMPYKANLIKCRASL